MKAVIMAGGEGTRLRPLTSMRPKPMVPVVNRPVMEHIVRLVRRHGITDIVATLQFMPEVIEDHFRDGGGYGVSMTYALEETPLGTAGSVKNAQSALGETFIVISGDALTDIDLGSVIDFHKEKGGSVTIALKRADDPLEFGIVITGEDGRIERFLEKPSWGQVFSDTINTGIYVIEPEVLDYIPADTPFDFSSELFPLLMEEGHELYGAVVDGYWCDIGTLRAYVDAQKDVLDGKVEVSIPGRHRADGLWVGEGSEVHPEARVSGKAVVGANVRVGPGVELGEYVVIGDNSLVGADARLERSVIWSDSVVGPGASLRGTVLGQRTDVRARAKFELDSVIGDESVVGDGAVVGNGVQVFPHKRIEPGAVVTTSLIWESKGLRSLFGEDGVSGLVSLDITPEMALRLAQAFGTTLPTGSHVVVSRDTSTAARMVKRAIIAGLNSAGINARDLRVASSAITRFTTRDMRCIGGIHVCGSADTPQMLEIRFFDEKGMSLSTTHEKKIERLYFRGEFRRSFFDQIGKIVYPPHALDYYSAALQEALAAVGTGEPRLRVVADMQYGVASLALPHVAQSWGVDLISLGSFADSEHTVVGSDERNEALGRMSHTVPMFEADLGAVLDTSGERLRLVTSSGRVLDPDTAMHAVVDLWCGIDDTDRRVVVPLTASRVVEELATRHGHAVARSGRSPREMAVEVLRGGVGIAAAQDGGFVVPGFLAAFDAVVALGMISRLLAASGRTLDDVVDGLPAFYLLAERVACPSEHKGTVMRTVMEQAAASGHEAETTEGVRVFLEDGWALVLPHPADPVVTVYVEGDDEAAAERILAQYMELVRDVAAAEVGA